MATTTTTTTTTQISVPALAVEVNPHRHHSGYWTATISTPNCTKRINSEGARLPTVMKNVQVFLDEVRNLGNNPAALMAASLTS